MQIKVPEPLTLKDWQKKDEKDITTLRFDRWLMSCIANPRITGEEKLGRAIAVIKKSIDEANGYIELDDYHMTALREIVDAVIKTYPGFHVAQMLPFLDALKEE